MVGVWGCLASAECLLLCACACCVCVRAGLKDTFIKNFKENAIDGAALADVDSDDLAGMGIKKEENQKKLLSSIRKLFGEARPKTVAL